ncbi:thioredoxin family protein [Syntrophomonas curvata]
MKQKPINVAIIAVMVLLLGIFLYYKFIQPGNESAPAPGSSTAARQIEAGKQAGGSMWLLFRSANCPSCVELKKIYDRIEPEYKGKVKFISIDVDDKENAQLAKDYGIAYVPTTFIIDGKGKLSYKEVGTIAEDDLRTELDKVVKP